MFVNVIPAGASQMLNEFEGITSLKVISDCRCATLTFGGKQFWTVPANTEFYFSFVAERNDCFTVVQSGSNSHVFETAKTEFIRKSP